MAETTHADDESEHHPTHPSPLRRTGLEGRRVRRLTHQIRSFALTHGGGAEGHLAHVGRGAVRLALVGVDGAWGTLVAPSAQTARQAAAAAELPLRDEFGGDLAARVRTGPYEWSRMAGIQLGGPGNG